jgi:hypothetical protein
MTDVETTLRRGLHALADDVDPVAPALATLLEVRRPRRHRALAAGALVGSVLLLGAGATATGRMPAPVQSAFDRMAGWGDYGVSPDDAQLVATATLDGVNAEYWVSVVPGGRRCEHVRLITDGRSREGWSGCAMDADQLSGSPELFTAYSTGSRQPNDLAGHAPGGTATVIVRFADGTADQLPVTERGYFLGLYRRDLEDVRSIDALDAAGDVIARRQLSRPSG